MKFFRAILASIQEHLLLTDLGGKEFKVIDPTPSEIRCINNSSSAITTKTITADNRAQCNSSPTMRIFSSCNKKKTNKEKWKHLR